LLNVIINDIQHPIVSAHKLKHIKGNSKSQKISETKKENDLHGNKNHKHHIHKHHHRKHSHKIIDKPAKHSTLKDSSMTHNKSLKHEKSNDSKIKATNIIQVRPHINVSQSSVEPKLKSPISQQNLNSTTVVKEGNIHKIKNSVQTENLIDEQSSIVERLKNSAQSTFTTMATGLGTAMEKVKIGAEYIKDTAHNMIAPKHDDSNKSINIESKVIHEIDDKLSDNENNEMTNNEKNQIKISEIQSNKDPNDNDNAVKSTDMNEKEENTMDFNKENDENNNHIANEKVVSKAVE